MMVSNGKRLAEGMHGKRIQQLVWNKKLKLKFKIFCILFIGELPKTAYRFVCRNNMLSVHETINCINPIPTRAPAIFCGPNEHDTKACKNKLILLMKIYLVEQ